MTRIILASAAAIAIASIASAQPAPPPAPPAAMAHGDMMGDKVMTRNDMLAKVRSHFAMMDANRDGALSQDEIGTGAHAMVRHGDHQMEAHAGPMGDPNAMFDRLDTNKDGSISRDEFAKGHQMRIEKRIVMQGQGAPGDAKAAGWPHMHQMGGKGMHAGMMRMADANGDGKVTQAEAEAMALKHFDQMDANRDGKVTPEERRAARPMMMQLRKEMKRS